MKIKLILFVIIFCLIKVSAQEVQISGKAKISIMDVNNGAGSLVVKLPDGTLGIRSVGSIPINDADASTANEIQSLSLSGNTLGLSLGGGLVNLNSFTSPWNYTGSSLYFNTGKIGIGDNSPIATLTVGNGDKFQVHGADGDVVFKDDQGSIRFANSNGPNAAMMQMFSSGTSNSTRMFVAHSASFSDWGIMYNDTADAFTFIGNGNPVLHVGLNSQDVGIGTFIPEAKLHIVDNTNPGAGQIKLTETETDDARITFNNVTYPEHWDLKASTGSSASTSYMRMNYNNEDDVLSIRGSGQIGINDVIPSYPLEINGAGASRTLNLYNELPPTFGSSFNYGIRVTLTQAANSGSPRLINIYGVTTDTDSDENYGIYGSAQNAETSSYGVFGNTPTNDGYAGYFNGNVFSTGTYTPSDPKFKKEMHNLEGGLEKVLELTPLTYQYRLDEFPEMNFEDKEHFGFNAEEIEQVFPTLINQTYQPIDDPENDREGDRGTWFKAVNYQGLIPILTKAIQEQQAVISALEDRIELLEARLK